MFILLYLSLNDCNLRPKYKRFCPIQSVFEEQVNCHISVFKPTGWILRGNTKNIELSFVGAVRGESKKGSGYVFLYLLKGGLFKGSICKI